MDNQNRLQAIWRAFDAAWVGLDRIAISRMTLSPRGDGFIEGYEAGLREARGIALVAMADAYRPFGDPNDLPDEMVRLGGARLSVAQALDILGMQDEQI